MHTTNPVIDFRGLDLAVHHPSEVAAVPLPGIFMLASTNESNGSCQHCQDCTYPYQFQHRFQRRIYLRCGKKNQALPRSPSRLSHARYCFPHQMKSRSLNASRKWQVSIHEPILGTSLTTAATVHCSYSDRVPSTTMLPQTRP